MRMTPPRPLGTIFRVEVVRHGERGPAVHVDHLQEVVERPVEEGPHRREGGVVDEQAHLVVAGERVQHGDEIRAGHVGRGGADLDSVGGAELGGERLERSRAPRHEQEVQPAGGEGAREGLADALRGSRDERPRAVSIVGRCSTAVLGGLDERERQDASAHLKEKLKNGKTGSIPPLWMMLMRPIWTPSIVSVWFTRPSWRPFTCLAWL